MDILARVSGKVIEFSDDGPSENVVEVKAHELNELMIEIIRLRAKLEEISERSTVFSSVGQLQRMAREGILPDDSDG